MNRYYWLIFASMLAMQCNSDKGSVPKAAARPAGETAPATVETGNEASTKSESMSGASADMKTLDLVAGVEHPKDGAPKTFDVQLKFSNSGEITGKAMLEGSALKLSGVRDDNQIRVWVAGNVDDEARVRRGYLIGEITKDDAVSGRFAISGNGGTPSYRGVLANK